MSADIPALQVPEGGWEVTTCDGALNRVAGHATSCPAGRQRARPRPCVAGHGRTRSWRRHLALTGLVIVLAGSGVLHLVRARPYRRMVPTPLARWRPEVVAVSGLAEISCALLLLIPKTRRIGAYASASLFVAVFPANVHMALHSGDADTAFPATRAAGAWLRLPLQVPLIWWALSYRHRPHVSGAAMMRGSAPGAPPGSVDRPLVSGDSSRPAHR
jgi:uncharacterized membrane protein